MIDKKRGGIIALLDEESIRPGNPTDKEWLEKMTKARPFLMPLSDAPFCIFHLCAPLIFYGTNLPIFAQKTHVW